MDTVVKNLTWSDILDSVTKLDELIRGDDFIPDVIITIGRGGMIPGTLLAYYLNVKIIHNFSVQTYNENNVKSGFIISIQEPGHSLALKHRDDRVLVVDDISDGGSTLEYIKNELVTNFGLNNLRFATLYTKPHTAFTPDYYITEYPNESWITFPWEVTN
jgi:hypoxanthine phosphoribosyltransferase